MLLPRPLVCLLVAPGLAAIGQEPDSTSRADSVRRLAAVHVLGSVIPAAGPEIGSDVPARVTIVAGRAVRAAHPGALWEALATRGGATLYDDLGSPFKSTLVTRGFTASPVVGVPQGVSVFVDGVPVNEPDAGQVNFDLLPLAHVERVEILSGTASLLGPNSLGGAINLITRAGGGAPSLDVVASAGSFGRRSVETSATGGARGWRYTAGGAYEREAGWRQLTGARLGNGFVRIGRSGETAGVTLQAFGGRSYAETAGSLPRSVYVTRPDSNLSAGDFEDLEQLHLAATGYAPLVRGTGSLSVWLRRHRAQRFNVNQQDDPDVRSFSRSRTIGGAAEWRARREAGPATLGVRAGVGGSANSVGVRIFAERLSPGLTTDVDSPIGKLDAYGTADVVTGRLTLSAGARYDVVRVPFANRLRPERDTVSTFARLSPRAGLGVDLGGGAMAFASVGRSFRAPAVIELACADPTEPCPLPFALGDDPPLAPVVATTREIGGRWARGPVVLSAAAYRTDVRDDIFLFPYEDESEPAGSTIDGYFANVPRTRRAGIEAGLEAVLRGAHEVYATYAYTSATFQTSGLEIFSIREAAGGENEIGVGDRFPLVPDHALSLGGTLGLRGGLSVGADARYVGERRLRGDEANEEPPLAAYVTTQLRVRYHAGEWDLRATVTNLLDREYATFGTFNINQGAAGVVERFLTPGERRGVRFSVRRRFTR